MYVLIMITGVYYGNIATVGPTYKTHTQCNYAGKVFVEEAKKFPGTPGRTGYVCIPSNQNMEQ